MPFSNSARAEMAYLIQAGCDNLDRLRAEIVGIQQDMQRTETTANVGMDRLRANLTTKAAAAADIDTALADIATAKQCLLAIQAQLCDIKTVAELDAKAIAICNTLDEIQHLGRRINKSAEAFNRVIRTTAESN